MTTKAVSKAAPKAAAKATAKPVKRDNALCHFGGPRMSYGATTTAVCNTPKVAKRELCADHEAKWKVVAKARAAAKRAADPKPAKPAKAATPAAAKPTRNGGGAKRDATAPVLPHIPAAAIPRVVANAPEQAPNVRQLMAHR
jgi:hypothetical protein